MGIVEVGHVAPVVRGGGRMAPLFQRVGDQLVLAETGGAHQKEVETFVVHSDAELDRLHGPLLSDTGAQGLELRRRREPGLGEVAGMVQVRDRDGLYGVHRVCPIAAARKPLGR